MRTVPALLLLSVVAASSNTEVDRVVIESCPG